MHILKAITLSVSNMFIEGSDLSGTDDSITIILDNGVIKILRVIDTIVDDKEIDSITHAAELTLQQLESYLSYCNIKEYCNNNDADVDADELAIAISKIVDELPRKLEKFLW